MSGYAILMAGCLICGRVFGSNPKRVPSHNGEPICRKCMGTINEKRKEMGIPEFTVPSDAYEPVDENEL